MSAALVPIVPSRDQAHLKRENVFSFDCIEKGNHSVRRSPTLSLSAKLREDLSLGIASGTAVHASPAVAEGSATTIIPILHHVGFSISSILENAIGIVVAVLP